MQNFWKLLTSKNLMEKLVHIMHNYLLHLNHFESPAETPSQKSQNTIK